MPCLCLHPPAHLLGFIPDAGMCCCCCACTLQGHGVFAELLLVLLLPFCPELLALFDVHKSAGVSMVWENQGSEQGGPRDGKMM